MKVTIFEQSGLSEDYAEIYCGKETPEIKTIANYIESGVMQIQGKADGSMKKLFLNDIFYFESVDKKTYAYLKETVWEVEFLAGMKEILSGGAYENNK